jgi:hypothetical protein
MLRINGKHLIYMYIYIYICIETCIYLYIYMYTHIYIYLYNIFTKTNTNIQCTQAFLIPAILKISKAGPLPGAGKGGAPSPRYI